MYAFTKSMPAFTSPGNPRERAAAAAASHGLSGWQPYTSHGRESQIQTGDYKSFNTMNPIIQSDDPIDTSMVNAVVSTIVLHNTTNADLKLKIGTIIRIKKTPGRVPRGVPSLRGKAAYDVVPTNNTGAGHALVNTSMVIIKPGAYKVIAVNVFGPCKCIAAFSQIQQVPGTVSSINGVSVTYIRSATATTSTSTATTHDVFVHSPHGNGPVFGIYDHRSV